MNSLKERALDYCHKMYTYGDSIQKGTALQVEILYNLLEHQSIMEAGLTEINHALRQIEENTSKKAKK